MATLEKVIVKVYPMGEQHKPYVITFEHTAPNFIARKLQERIGEVLREEFIADGIEQLRVVGV